MDNNRVEIVLLDEIYFHQFTGMNICFVFDITLNIFYSI